MPGIDEDARKERVSGAFVNHFSTPLTSENSALRAVPRFVNTVTSAIAIKLAINAYSIAVAPRSSSRKDLGNRIGIIGVALVFLRQIQIGRASCRERGEI